MYYISLIPTWAIRNTSATTVAATGRLNSKVSRLEALSLSNSDRAAKMKLPSSAN